MRYLAEGGGVSEQLRPHYNSRRPLAELEQLAPSKRCKVNRTKLNPI